MFKVVGTKSLDSNAIEFTDEGINFVGRTFENNGIQGKIQKREFEPNEAFTITATVIGNYKYVKFQTAPYYCSQNINKLMPNSLFLKWDYKIAYYLVAGVQKFVSLYDGQQGGYKLNDIKSHRIQLPTKNNQIDFEFMEYFVAALEAERITALDTYLQKNGLKDYTLTPQEQKALADFENGQIEFGEFTAGHLFNIENTPSFNKDKLVLGNDYDYVTRTSQNQGILQQTGFVNQENINSAGNWSLGLLQMDFFYRKNPWYAGQFIRKITAKTLLSEYSAHFFTTLFNLQKEQLLSVLVRDVDEMFLQLKLNLPTLKNGNPDYQTIETIISAVHKLLIKDIVLYCEQKISVVRQLA